MKHSGFTLLELVVSVAVSALILGAGWFSFSSYAARQELKSGSARVAALIVEARSKTLSGEGASAWGVHFESDKAVLFKAPSYSSTGADNKTETMPRRIIISSNTFSSNEVVFARLTASANAGSVTLSVRGNSSISKIIYVNTLGVVEGE